MRKSEPNSSIGVRASLNKIFLEAARSAEQAPSKFGCARLKMADLALRGAMAAAHINECDTCRAEHLAIRAALACIVTKPPAPAPSSVRGGLRVITGGR
jgi:hypothetical protein